MSQICRVCGKEFVALYPHLWAYRHGNDYYCSWKCLRAEGKGDESNMKTIVTKEQKQKAVSMAIDGKDPLEYLREIGSKSPDKMWYYIKASVRKSDPELYAKIPDLRKIVGKAEAGPVVKVDGAIRIETPEAGKVQVMETPEGCSGLFVGTKGAEAEKVKDVVPEEFKKHMNPEALEYKIYQPLSYDGLEVSAVRHPELGEFYHDQKYKCIDWRTPEGDEVSMSLQAWKNLYYDLPNILGVLGVGV